jgi:hypothetical protein
MDINKISLVVSLLIALSVASERLVAIVKGLVPFLNQENTDPVMEGRRTSALQLLAVVSGIVTALLAGPAIGTIVGDGLNSPVSLIALGLLASGGSGFWNSVQGYVNQVKDIKKLEAKERKGAVAALRTPPSS